MIRPETRWGRAVLLAAILMSAPAAFADEARNRLVVFGDSLSDPGNHYAVYGLTSQPPFAPVPDEPYDIRGHHYSNGPTWVETLAKDLDTATSGGPALVQPGVYTNYAFGRARARPGAPGFPGYDLSTQVGLFLADFHGQARPDATYVVWIGGNDVRDALVALATDTTGATSGTIIYAAIHSIADNIVTLWATGARTFLVPNLADPGLAPAIRALGPQAAGAASYLGGLYNQGLGQALDVLTTLPGIKFVRFDDATLISQVAANPATFDFEQVAIPCLSFGVIVNAVCEEPGDYLFWDGVHPTTATHRMVARAALRALRAQGVVTKE